MMKTYNVLFYSDSSIFGGHEMTLCDALEGLSAVEKFRVTVMLSRKNTRFISYLSKLKNLDVVLTDFETQPGDVFRTLFSSAKVKAISERMQLFKPDVVVVSQGAVGLSACGLRAAANINSKLVSFLPMAHPVALTRGKSSVAVFLQEYFYRKLYRIPNFFFTICKSTADQLYDFYCVKKKDVFVSYYGVDVKNIPAVSYKYSSDSDRPRKVGIIGRVEFYQKRQDFFLKGFAKSDLANNTEIYVIGDGPDLEKCKKLAESLGIASKVHFEGWVDEISTWYEACDSIILPSRFEGLPIVVIEAMYYGVPIVASRVDGMKEILPSQWLFQEADMEAMIGRLREVLSEDQTEIVAKNQEVVVAKLNLTSYKNQFKENLLHVCETDLGLD